MHSSFSFTKALQEYTYFHTEAAFYFVAKQWVFFRQTEVLEAPEMLPGAITCNERTAATGLLQRDQQKTILYVFRFTPTRTTFFYSAPKKKNQQNKIK